MLLFSTKHSAVTRMLSGADKGNQFFDIIESVIITRQSFPVLYDTGCLVAFQTVQQSFISIPFYK